MTLPAWMDAIGCNSTKQSEHHGLIESDTRRMVLTCAGITAHNGKTDVRSQPMLDQTCFSDFCPFRFVHGYHGCPDVMASFI